jgi:lysophospholipase L1-like esterase
MLLVCDSWQVNGSDAFCFPADCSRKTVFFGANDACIQGGHTKQHVPLDEYRRNLEAILTHPQVKAQSPRLILITPPPVDEHQFLAQVQAASETEISRTAIQTKAYADVCREVGKNLDIATLDFWSLVMAKTGWKEGEKLPGSLELEQDPTLKAYLHDGKQICGD